MTNFDIDTADRPFLVIWEVTQACDLSCKHCRASAQPACHPAELSTAEGMELLEDIRRFGPGQLVVLSGGDPLYRDDIEPLVRHGTDLGLRMTMTPSGTASLTSTRIERLLDAGLKRMALSLDGATADQHDEFRGEPGSFEQTIAAARAAASHDLPLQINTTVCGETVDVLPAICDLVSDLGAVLWSVFFLVPIGRGRVLNQLSPERTESVMEWLTEVSQTEPVDVNTTEAPHYRRVALQHGAGPAGSGPPGDGIGRRAGITAGDGFVFVGHTGEIYPSGFLPVPAGTVPNDSVVDHYRSSSLFRRLRDRSNLSGKCGVCEFRNVCGGSRSRAYATTGDPFASDPLCAYVPDAFNESPTEGNP